MTSSSPLRIAVEDLADAFDPLTASDVAPSLGCFEVNKLARVLALAGHPDHAEAWLRHHLDEDDEGDHHIADAHLTANRIPAYVAELRWITVDSHPGGLAYQETETSDGSVIARITRDGGADIRQTRSNEPAVVYHEYLRRERDIDAAEGKWPPTP